MEKNEKKSMEAMIDLQKLMEKYEDTFGELPPLPKCGSYSTIADLMEDAIIAKKPLTWDDVIGEFENIEYDTGD